MRISLIAAVAANGVIGRDGNIPWRLPDDLRYFKRVTMGKPILMGRKTHQSIGRPLPGRQNIVLTRDPTFRAPGCDVVHSVAEALETAHSTSRRGSGRTAGADELMVIGGAELYAAFLPYADRFYLTLIDAEIPGDTQFPDFDRQEWREASRETHAADESHPFRFAFVVLERNNKKPSQSREGFLSQ